MKTPLIELTNVHKSFGNNQVLKGISLSLYKGEVACIIGKSGCGKSVLLKHIIGLMEQESGDIFFDGQNIASMKKGDKKQFRQKFSYMFQDNALFDSMTIAENIALPLQEKGLVPKKEINTLVSQMLEKFEIEQSASRYPAELSGGMRKRVALARALITQPEIILFDEPTTGLDPIRRNSVHEMIDNYRKIFGFTCIIVSHEVPDVFSICQRAIMLEGGTVLFEGSVQDIVESTNPTIRSFIHTR